MREPDRLVAPFGHPGVAWLVASAGILALLTIHPPADPDLFARVAVGRLVEVNGGVVERDPFAFTPVLERWVDHEWLSGVVFWEVARRGGDAGLLALDLALMLLTVGLVLRAQEEAFGASSVWAFLTLVPAAGIWISVVRSRVFTFLFVGVLLLVLVRWRNGRVGWIWLLPPCFAVWANLHGGFVAGLGLLGVATLAAGLRDPRRALPLAACLVACVAATLLNPYGLDYWGYILDATTRERPMILEWQTLQGWQIGLVAVLGLLFVEGVRRAEADARPPPEGWAMLAVSLWATVDSQRLLNFLLVVLCVYGAGAYRAGRSAWLGRLPDPWRRAVRRVLAGTAAVGTVALLVVAARGLVGFAHRGLSYESYPVGAVDWLQRSGAGGRLLTHFNHGSYALWRLYPDYLVAVDGRYEETYPEETVATTRLALRPWMPGHGEALRTVDPDYVIVPDPGSADDFAGEWDVVYRDGVSAVLARPGTTRRIEDPRPPRAMWTPGF